MQHDRMFWKLALPEPKLVTRTNAKGETRVVEVSPVDNAANRNKRFGKMDKREDTIFNSCGQGVVHTPYAGPSRAKIARLELEAVHNNLKYDNSGGYPIVQDKRDHDKLARIAAYKAAQCKRA